MSVMGNNVVISGSSGRGDWCFLNGAAYESILLSITYSYFCSRESCIRRHAGGQSFSWETLRRKQWQQWHVLQADLLLNLCTLINLSTVPARASPPFRGTPSTTMACQLCLTVVFTQTVQKFPLRDTEFILPYKRVCHSGSFSRSLRWVWV